MDSKNYEPIGNERYRVVKGHSLRDEWVRIALWAVGAVPAVYFIGQAMWKFFTTYHPR